MPQAFEIVPRAPVTGSPGTPVDGVLVTRMAGGDERALGTLYDRHGRTLFLPPERQLLLAVSRLDVRTPGRKYLRFPRLDQIFLPSLLQHNGLQNIRYGQAHLYAILTKEKSIPWIRI